LSAAKCEPGWGDGPSTRAPFAGRDCHPTPPLISFASTLPLQGRVRKRYHANSRLKFQTAEMISHKRPRSPGDVRRSVTLRHFPPPPKVVIPAKAGNQYAAAYRFNHWRLGVLDRPLSRATTVGRGNRYPTSLRANGSRECAPDDRLREAIHSFFLLLHGLLRRFAPRNDGKYRYTSALSRRDASEVCQKHPP
jgi:hypothetical protein